MHAENKALAETSELQLVSTSLSLPRAKYETQKRPEMREKGGNSSTVSSQAQKRLAIKQHLHALPLCVFEFWLLMKGIDDSP